MLPARFSAIMVKKKAFVRTIVQFLWCVQRILGDVVASVRVGGRLRTRAQGARRRRTHPGRPGRRATPTHTLP